MKTKTRWTLSVLLAGLLACATCAAETPYPNRPIRLVVGSAAGGGNDFVARAINQKVSTALGQPLIIENMGGAAGLVASESVAKAAPDGYTLLLVFANFATFPSMKNKVHFDARKDLVPISNIASTPLILTVSNSLPAKSVQELIALAKSGKTLDCASPGTGSMGYMAAQLFQHTAHIATMQHIPYRGGGPAIMSVMSGEVQMYFSTPPAALTQVSAGRLRALAVTSKNRAPFAPDLPTLAEAGLPGYEVNGWVGLLAPAGTPPAIVNKLNRVFADAVKDPATRAALAKEGVVAVGNTPAEFASQLNQDIKKWGALIDEAHLTME
jgi:tripartite-type tricarboxylate transporter receptor subunit TctC